MYEFGRRHPWVGAVLTILVVYLCHSYQPPGESLAIAPAVIGALAVGSALASYKGSKARGGRPYAPSRGFLEALERFYGQDIRRLRGPRPFAGEDLGFTPEEMGARIGEGVGQAQSEYASNLSDIETQAARRGPYAAVSGAFYRGRQRAAGGLLARSAETRRRNIITDALQRRDDLYRRMAAEMAPWGIGSALQQRAELVRGEQKGAKWDAIASLLASFGGGGGGGGVGLATV